MTTKQNTRNTIAALKSDRIGLNGHLHETKLLRMDESLEVMAKIWITLSPSQKEALIAEATRASRLNRAIEAFNETKTDPSEINEASENAKTCIYRRNPKG